MGSGLLPDVAKIPLEESGRWQSVPYLVSGAASYCLYLTWLVSYAFLPSFSESISVADSFACHAAMFAAFFASLLIGGMFADRLASRSGQLALLVLSIVCCPCSAVASIASPSLEIAVGTWAVSGLGGGFLLLQQASFLCSLEHRALLLATPACMAVAAFSMVGVAYAPALLRVHILFAVVVLSASLAVYPRTVANAHAPSVTARESRHRGSVSFKAMGATIGNSLCIGLTLYCASLACDEMWRFALFGIVMAVAACALAAGGGHSRSGAFVRAGQARGDSMGPRDGSAA